MTLILDLFLPAKVSICIHKLSPAVSYLEESSLKVSRDLYTFFILHNLVKFDEASLVMVDIKCFGYCQLYLKRWDWGGKAVKNVNIYYQIRRLTKLQVSVKLKIIIPIPKVRCRRQHRLLHIWSGQVTAYNNQYLGQIIENHDRFFGLQSHALFNC